MDVFRYAIASFLKKIIGKNGPPKLGSKTTNKLWDQVARISIMMLKRSSRAKIWQLIFRATARL